MEFQRAFSPARAIDSTWRALKAYPSPLLVGGLLLVFLGGEVWVNLDPAVEIPSAGEWGTWFHDWTVELATPRALLIALATGLLRCLVLIGVADVMEGALSRGTPRVAQVFAARGRYWNMLQAVLLQALLGLVGSAPLVAVGWLSRVSQPADLDPVGGALPIVGFVAVLTYLLVVLYVALGVSLMTEAVAVEGLGARAALTRSWTLVRGHRAQLIGYHIFLWLFALAGVLLFCVGVYLTTAIVQLALFESYLRLVRSSEEQVGWQRAG